MEGKWLALSTVAPLAWGANYVVTRELLPADDPLWGAALRALPAGVVLLLIARALPRGSWWWRSTVLGVLNVSAFYVLVYLASHLLPSSVAASIMSLAPLALAGFGWAVLSERPSARALLGGVAGIVGVLLLIGGASGSLSWGGVAASLIALTSSALGSTLGKRWRDGTPVLHSTAWQVSVGALILTPIAIGFEGMPPSLGWSEIAGFAFTSVIATALASVCWFASINHLPVAIVGVVGLLNPLAGITLGTLVSHEHLSAAQIAGIGIALVGLLLATATGPGTRKSHRAQQS